jgi:uncharacterized protein YndB with AHSA1/START domain
MNDHIDRQKFTLNFERLLTASCEQVFAAWTHPEQIAKWWDPSGAPLVACTIDLRQDGAFRFQNAGHSPAFCGVYKVIEPPSRLEFEALGTYGTVSLQPEGNGTRMRVTIRCGSAEHFAMFLDLGVNENTSKTLDNLVEHMRSRAT